VPVFNLQTDSVLISKSVQRNAAFFGIILLYFALCMATHNESRFYAFVTQINAFYNGEIGVLHVNYCEVRGWMSPHGKNIERAQAPQATQSRHLCDQLAIFRPKFCPKL